MPLTFDSSTAYAVGAIVEAAYRLFKPDVLNPPITDGVLPAGWKMLGELTAIDRVGHKTEQEFFGLALQSQTAPELLIVIRGTDTLLEWLVDVEFTPRAFPGVQGAGLVEDGFCGVYSSLRCPASNSDVLSLVRGAAPGTRVTIAGHSLGAAVATLLALDVAVNAPGTDLTLYTFASPRVGDGTFAAFCNTHVPLHYRIANRPDIVPKLPPLFVHTGIEVPVDSLGAPNIAHKLECYHTLTTYLWLLNQQSSFGLGQCARPAAGVAPLATPAQAL